MDELSRREFLARAAMLGVAGAALPALLEACASGAPSSGGTKEARTFTFGYDQPHDTGYGFFADTFDKKLQELSGGTMKIHQFPGAALGQEPEMAQKVRTGDIDFVINSTANTASVVPQAGIFSVHYIFRDKDHLKKVVNDAKVNATFKEMIKQGTTGAFSLGLSTLGFRNMYAKFQITGIADVKGKKVRVQATKTEDALFSAYGCVPVHMPFGQVYTALQTGAVDIAENGNDIYLKNKHYEVAPILSATEHEANNFHLWVSQKTWDSLAPQQQKWVQQAVDYTRPLAANKSLELSAAAVKSLQSLGVKWVDKVDKSGFRTVAQPLQDSIAEGLGSYAQELLREVRAL
jgi:tripartite ATP-independent transporter DctP family solute receptor